MTGPAFGQTVAPGSGNTLAPAWRPAGDAALPMAPGNAAAFAPAANASAPSTFAAAAAAPLGQQAPHQHIANVTNGSGSLPNSQGQVWREYDISPYTARVTTTKHPEQAIVDWILRETGYEVWHNEPLGILSATPRTLRVYHTPEMQAKVADIVDRFVGSEAETQTFSLRVVTIDSPNWRSRAQHVMHPVPVQTPGASAWLLQKEDAAVLMADLQRRTDYREHSSPHLLVNNGQSTVVSRLRPRSYIRDVTLRPEVFPGFEAQTGQIDEGFSFEFSPLLSVDRRLIDAAIKCDIDQVEKMVPVIMELPTAASPRQRTKIEVPQMSHFRFHERFRWPIDQVLVIGMGMVAPPVPVDGNNVLAGLPLPTAPPRADLLVIVESKAQVAAPAAAARTPLPEPKTYRGRY
jgi:hypothetical protein